ncbi:hypothetical protein NL676_039091 [Syzygium grande]|nr:hypothetical protein NL676_039091 [Syzygium grande]
MQLHLCSTRLRSTCLRLRLRLHLRSKETAVLPDALQLSVVAGSWRSAAVADPSISSPVTKPSSIGGFSCTLPDVKFRPTIIMA